MLQDLQAAYYELSIRWSDWWDRLNWFDLIAAISVAAVCLALRRPFARITLRLIRWVFGSLGLELSDEVDRKLLPAVSILVVAFGAAEAVILLDFPPALNWGLLRIAGTAAILAIFSGVNAFLTPFEEKSQAYLTRRADLEVIWIARLVRIVALVVTGALVMRLWGIDIGGVLAGIGVLGAAIAFVLQDLLRNVVAGFTNSNENRFTVGDWIKVEGLVDGTVVRTALRSTTIRAFDLSVVHIPNQDLANRPLINMTRRPYRRISWQIDLTYGSSLEQLAGVCREIDSQIASNEDFIETDDAPRFVRVDEFGPSSIKLLVYCFANTRSWGEYLEIKERLALEIKRIVEDQGAAFAFPSRSIYVERSEMPNDPGAAAG